MIECGNINKIYNLKKGGASVEALSGFSLTLPNTGMVFVLGKSGSGKTTLLNLLGGLDKPSSGKILVNGRDISRFTEKEFDFYRNSFVGFIFQDFALIDEFNVGQNISFALELQNAKAKASDISTVLASVGLEGFENRKISSLSGGQKQRVAIARAIIKDPSMILADEPTGALDSETGNSVLSELKRLSESKLVVVVSHDREAAERYADRIIELKDGKIVSDRSLGEMPTEVSENGSLVLKKSKLPFAKGFLIGLSSAFKKPVRLVSSILLTATALSFFGVFSTLVLYDEVRSRRDVALKMHADSGLFSKSLVFKTKKHEYDYINDKEISSTDATTFCNAVISKEEIEQINSTSKTGLDYAGVYRTNDYPFEVVVNNEFVSPMSTKRCTCPFFSGFADCGMDYLKNNGMTLLAGHYPSFENEIAISRYHAEMIIDFYREHSENGDLIGNYDYSKIVGSTIKMSFCDFGFDYSDTLFDISGVVDTGPLNDYYLERIEARLGPNDVILLDDFTDYMRGTYHCLGFVSDGFYGKYAEAFSVSWEENIEGLSFPVGAYFEGLNIGNQPTSPDGGLFVYLSRFADLDLFSFYKPDCSSTEFVEPKENEIYVDLFAERSRYYSRYKDMLYDSLSGIEKANEEGVLPEFKSDQRNGELLTNCIAFAKTKDPLRFADLLESGYLREDITYLFDYFYEKAFQRYYIKSLLDDMVGLNITGNFQIQDLYVTSDFYNNIISPILDSECENDISLYLECFEYIKKNEELSNFANNILHLKTCRSQPGEKLYELQNAIFRALSSGRGGSVSEEMWEDFNRLYLEDCYLEVSHSVYGFPCSVENLVSFEITCQIPSLDAEFECPKEVSYETSSGAKGHFKVIGMYSFKYANKARDTDCGICFVNESYINKIAKCPKEVEYWTVTDEYQGSLDGRYNYVITKSTFSLEQVRELCRKGQGYEYRFVTKNSDEVDSFLYYFQPASQGIVIISLLLGVFAAALLATFISTAINSKKDVIGVIRCLGGRRSDIFGIFFGESLAIAIIAGVLASIIAAIECHILNWYAMAHFTSVAIFYFGPVNGLILLGVALAFSFLATFIPILRRTRVSPYAALRSE